MKLTNKTKDKEYYEVGQWFFDKTMGDVGVFGYVDDGNMAQVVFVDGSRLTNNPVRLEDDRISVKEFNEWGEEVAENIIPITIEEIIYREG